VEGATASGQRFAPVVEQTPGERTAPATVVRRRWALSVALVIAAFGCAFAAGAATKSSPAPATPAALAPGTPVRGPLHVPVAGVATVATVPDLKPKPAPATRPTTNQQQTSGVTTSGNTGTTSGNTGTTSSGSSGTTSGSSGTTSGSSGTTSGGGTTSGS
jgi:hypothetical protein